MSRRDDRKGKATPTPTATVEEARAPGKRSPADRRYGVRTKPSAKDTEEEEDDEGIPRVDYQGLVEPPPDDTPPPSDDDHQREPAAVQPKAKAETRPRSPALLALWKTLSAIDLSSPFATICSELERQVAGLSAADRRQLTADPTWRELATQTFRSYGFNRRDVDFSGAPEDLYVRSVLAILGLAE